ncbi:MAG TPA: bifunctional UDP-sugar hydrolase/5'-nucleotidase [Polyangiaceae bacterium]|nr:bifunctional UDP-sugar hydrolase/5'-nucleotidase [Polyangiaceae bacterium]
MRFRHVLAGGLMLAGLALGGCPEPARTVELAGQVRLTLLHTSDLHSRLFPYDLQINQADAKLGLGPVDRVVRVGGAARIAHIIGRERARADRALHIDGGDSFQGAPIFNFFSGAAELRALSEMGADAAVVANHEFDVGGLNFSNQVSRWATFPIVAANYRLDDPAVPGSSQLARVLSPWTAFNVDGLKVAVIGMGNLSSITSLYEQPNRLGITPLATVDTAQFYVDLVRPLVDVVVFVTHLGLEYDEFMIRNTTGIDVVLGGHNHIVLQPPQHVTDCDRVDPATGEHYIEVPSPEPQAPGERIEYVRRPCRPRDVVLAHSGAFAKYVGRLDLALSNDPSEVGAGYDPINGFEVVADQYTIFPVTEDTPEDPHLVNTLEPYRQSLDALIDLELLVGYAPAGVSRVAPAGGDSPLGNMVATAMWLRQGIQTDFALTNTQGIRADIPTGPVTLEQLYNTFPFDNSITKMQLSGVEVQELFNFNARRSASRGCSSQAQIAGARVVNDCLGCATAFTGQPCATDDDCGGSDRCDDDGRVCQARACATDIYIGVNPDQPCAGDDQCGGRPGSCDLGSPDAQGQGRCGVPIDPIGNYELATSNYLALGGSGFIVLKKNTTQFDTRVQQRDALIDYMRQGKPCGYSEANGTDDGLRACSEDAECEEGYACACTGRVAPRGDGTCQSAGACEGASGRCVLVRCRDDVAAFHRRTCNQARSQEAYTSCETQLNPCEIGGESCKFLACVDERLGNFADGRQRMVGR